MTDILQGLIITTVESLCCILFFETFLNKRVKKQWIGFFLVCIFILMMTFVAVLQIDQFFLKGILIISIIFIIMEIYYKGSIAQIIFLTLAFYGMLIAIDKVLMILVQYQVIFQYDYFSQEPMKVTILALLCKAVLFICVVLLNKKLKYESSFNLISNTEWLRFLFFPFLTIISILAFIMGENQNQNVALIISFGLIIGNFIMLYMIKNIVYKEKRLQEIRLVQERTKNQMDMYMQMSQMYHEQKKKVHEYKNQISCIQGLLISGNQFETLKYVNKIYDTWVDEMDYVNTNNAVANAVINQKLRQAKAKGISIIMLINDLKAIVIKDEDLVTLLANLLDTQFRYN